MCWQNPSTRAALIDNLVQTLEKQGYAGVDIDFEYIPPEDAESYTAFIREVRARLEPLGKIVMVALAPKTSAGSAGSYTRRTITKCLARPRTMCC